jgi:hypothetical protein
MKPRLTLSAAVVLWMLCITSGCGARHTKTVEDYKATVRSGKAALPIAVQMEEVFPVADHFITHYAMDSGPLAWNTEVFFGGRYILTMQVDVEVNYSTNTVTSTNQEPQFFLSEVESVDLLPDGRTSVTFRAENAERFGAREWARMYDNKGSLSAIGISVDTTEVENFDEHVAQRRRDRVRMSLLAE